MFNFRNICLGMFTFNLKEYNFVIKREWKKRFFLSCARTVQIINFCNHYVFDSFDYDYVNFSSTSEAVIKLIFS